MKSKKVPENKDSHKSDDEEDKLKQIIEKVRIQNKVLKKLSIIQENTSKVNKG